VNHEESESKKRVGDPYDKWTPYVILLDFTAKRAVKKYWPEAVEWRFCSEKPGDWLPGDRFPMKAKV